MRTLTTDGHIMLRLANGQPVYNPTLITHSDTHTLVALQICGPQESVKANWAYLMNGSRTQHRLHSDGFVTLNGAGMHITLKRNLQSGWLELWLIHKQASYHTLNPIEPRFYLLPPQNEHPARSFFLFLDKALTTPMLTTWAPFLWQQGLKMEQIKPLPETEALGRTAYVISSNITNWNTIIRDGLQSLKISLKGATP